MPRRPRTPRSRRCSGWACAPPSPRRVRHGARAPAGTVDVELRRQDDALILSVEDSGPGIPEQDRKRVLDRFYRVAGTETTGSGLGLAIVKAIADLHGASLVLGRSARLGGLAVQVRFKARD